MIVKELRQQKKLAEIESYWWCSKLTLMVTVKRTLRF
jgi:hypothetical protein